MKRLGVTAVVLVVLVTGAFTGFASAEQSANAGGASGGHNGDRPSDPGTFYLNQSVNFGERVIAADGTNYGVYMDGSLFEVDAIYTNPDWPTEQHMMYSADVLVQADWSDNLVLHKWRAGDKIRTEVILQDIADPSISIYTIRASFAIEQVHPVTGEVIADVWSGTTFEGLWVDGVTDAYSAEVNQLGMLLYGYNWDTGNLPAGQYRLTFTLTPAPIPTYPGTDIAIDFNAITIDGMVDPDMYASDPNYSLFNPKFTSSSTTIEVYLYEK